MPRDTTADSNSPDGLLVRAVDWVFGYDFFISYSHGDGLAYPRRLRERLEQSGFRVFLDQTEFVPGVDLRRETRRQVEKSRQLVVLGRPSALRSEWVRREVDVALSRGKVPIIIDVNDAVARASSDAELAAMARDRHWLRIIETVDNPDGVPSDHTLGELARSFGHTRQQTKRQRVLAAAVTVLATTTGLATWQAVEARRQQAIAERNFETARTAADGLVVDLARGLKDVEGMSTESLRKILSRAETAFNTLAATAPEDRRLLQGRAAMYNEFVEAYLARGDTVAAGQAAEESVKLAKRLVVVAANDAAARRQLALGLVKVGDAMAEIGNWELARSAYQEALSIRETLAHESGDDDLVAQRDVAVSLMRLADSAQGLDDYAGARTLLERSLAMRKSLAARRPIWRRDVIVNHIGLGDALLKHGDHDGARAEFDAAVRLSRELRDAEPTSTRAARDYAVALQRQGNHALQLGEAERAHATYERSRQEFVRLHGLDRTNMEWRRDVGISMAKVADAAKAAGKLNAARDLMNEVVEFRRKLLSESPANALFATDLVEALKDLALLSDPDQALPLWREVHERLSLLARTQALREEPRGWLDLAKRHLAAEMRPTERLGEAVTAGGRRDN